MYRRLSVMAFIALATCASAPNKSFYTRDLCEAPWVKAPAGDCSAMYKQYFESPTATQVLISCKGGDFGKVSSLIMYRGHSEHGVALRWLSNDELELATPDVADDHPIEMRWLADNTVEGAWASGKVRTMDRPRIDGAAEGPKPMTLRTVHIRYRALTQRDGEWKHSCYLKRPKAKKP